MTGALSGVASTSRPHTEKDFLFGVYKWCREHSANQELMKLVRARLKEYEAADMKTDYMDQETNKKSKRDIREELVEHVLSMGGRFVQVKNKSGTSVVVLSKKAAIDKMSQVFKNCKRTVGGNVKGEEKQTEPTIVPTTAKPKKKEASVVTPAASPTVAPRRSSSEESKFDDEDLELALDGLISLGAASRMSARAWSGDYADVMSINSASAAAGEGLSWAVMSSCVNEPLSVEDRYSVMSYSRQGGTSSFNPDSLLQMSAVESISKPSTFDPDAVCLRWNEACPITEISTAPREVTDEIEAQLQRMKDNMRNETVVLDSMKALLPYTESYENDAIVAAAGGLDESGIDVFMRAMKTFPNNEKLQECGCVALGYLAKNIENKVAIANTDGGIDVITDAMKRFLENTTLQVGCFLALGNLSMDGNNGSTIARSGGIQAVVEAMKRFHYDGVIQSHGCFALSCLASDLPNKDEIAKADGITTVLLAMENFAPSERIQQHGCFALGSLALDDDNADWVVRAGGIRAISNAMAYFPKDEYVQSNAIFALANLATKGDHNRTAIAAANGLTLILDAMRHFPDSEEIQRYGAYALGNLAESHLNNANFIGQNGGVDLVIRALKKWATTNEDIVSSGCWALESLSENTRENRKRIAELQGVELARGCQKMLSQNAKRWLEDAISTLHDRFLFSDDHDEVEQQHAESHGRVDIRAFPTGRAIAA